MLLGAFVATRLIGAPSPDLPLKAAAEAAAPDALSLLKQLVSIDSGTGDVEGAAKVEAILASRMTELGAEIRKVPAEQTG